MSAAERHPVLKIVNDFRRHYDEGMFSPLAKGDLTAIRSVLDAHLATVRAPMDRLHAGWARHLFDALVRHLLNPEKWPDGWTLTDQVVLHDANTRFAQSNWELWTAIDSVCKIIEDVDNRAMAADGPVTKTRHEMTDGEMRTIYSTLRAVREVHKPAER